MQIVALARAAAAGTIFLSFFFSLSLLSLSFVGQIGRVGSRVKSGHGSFSARFAAIDIYSRESSVLRWKKALIFIFATTRRRLWFASLALINKTSDERAELSKKLLTREDRASVAKHTRLHFLSLYRWAIVFMRIIVQNNFRRFSLSLFLIIDEELRGKFMRARARCLSLDTAS